MLEEPDGRRIADAKIPRRHDRLHRIPRDFADALLVLRRDEIAVVVGPFEWSIERAVVLLLDQGFGHALFAIRLDRGFRHRARVVHGQNLREPAWVLLRTLMESIGVIPAARCVDERGPATVRREDRAREGPRIWISERELREDDPARIRPNVRVVVVAADQ